jgi:hypothetical protein
MRNRVVVRFKDGTLLKGYTLDFSPVKDMFHLISESDEDKGTTYEVDVEKLKAIFFVKTLEGNKEYKEKKRFEDVSTTQKTGLKIKVEFTDGEVMRGKTMVYSANRKGFFVFPVDPQSNNERIYVVSSSVQSVVTGPEAEE